MMMTCLMCPDLDSLPSQDCGMKIDIWATREEARDKQIKAVIEARSRRLGLVMSAKVNRKMRAK